MPFDHDTAVLRGGQRRYAFEGKGFWSGDLASVRWNSIRQAVVLSVGLKCCKYNLRSHDWPRYPNQNILYA